LAAIDIGLLALVSHVRRSSYVLAPADPASPTDMRPPRSETYQALKPANLRG